MNRFLVRLYPAAWRERYGEEFVALLEERPVGPFDVADVVLGALDARLRLRRQAVEAATLKGATTMSLRIGGFAAILGASIMTTALVVGTGLVSVDVDPVFALGVMVVGSILLLVALAGLSAFQARSHRRLAWAAFAVPAFGAMAMIVGIGGMGVENGPFWYVWFVGLLTFFVGSGFFALATYRTAVLSRRATLLLGVGSILPFGSGLMAMMEFAPAFQEAVLVFALAAFALGWAALGLEAIRLDRASPAPRPA
ncbi:MAG TPA: hypothetical protein VFK35_13250 [Candidatus Limnocylindrales bacterium]|nr:hypothetical protein [Candidatus Limnocylindrales bacterium]